VIPDRRQEIISEVRDPVEALIRSARASRRDTAVAAWATQVSTLANEVVEDARYVITTRTRIILWLRWTRSCGC
jgi:hypothetical protein